MGQSKVDFLGMSKTDYLPEAEYNRIYPYMSRDNALALEVAVATGMRIGDVLKIRKRDIVGTSVRYTAQKTGKKGVAPLPRHLADILRKRCSRAADYVFPGSGKTGHRTRQAVWKDVRKAAELAGIDDRLIAPHSARKTFAVELMHSKGIEAVQEALQHSRRDVTELYALSDIGGAGLEQTIAVVFSRLMPHLIDRIAVAVADEIERRMLL